MTLAAGPQALGSMPCQWRRKKAGRLGTSVTLSMVPESRATLP
jgi:hypothetical protein